MLHTTKQNQQQQINTHLSLCSGVKLGETLSRSSINIKSLPSPSYFANSILSPLFADRIVLLLDDILDVCVVDSVAKAFAIGMAVRMVAIESIVGFNNISGEQNIKRVYLVVNVVQLVCTMTAMHETANFCTVSFGDSPK